MNGGTVRVGLMWEFDQPKPIHRIFVVLGLLLIVSTMCSCIRVLRIFTAVMRFWHHYSTRLWIRKIPQLGN